jgi:hypothetical protein
MNKFTMFLVVVCMSGHVALADDAGKQTSDKKMSMHSMTTEQRQKMADAHEKMAVCLRSDKPVSDCHEEMKKACQEGMGKDGCPMMGGKGMHHGHMMDHDESDSKATK